MIWGRNIWQVAEDAMNQACDRRHTSTMFVHLELSLEGLFRPDLAVQMYNMYE